MARQAYPSDLSEAEWKVIEPLIPGRKTAPTSKREIVNAILFILRTGSQWRYLPHDFPPWTNVYDYYRRWTQRMVWLKLNDALRESVRKHEGKKDQPTAAIIDSQSVKTTETGSEKGFDAGKKNQGNKTPYCC